MPTLTQKQWNEFQAIRRKCAELETANLHLRQQRDAAQLTLAEKSVMSYQILNAPNSLCPNCHKPIVLLCADDISQMRGSPAFGICFECKFVGQIGVGPVTAAQAGAPEKGG